METQNSSVTRAEELKLQANEAFKAHKYAQAIDLYSQAIELNGENAVYWANRALAHSKLEEYGSAIQDASKAIEIDPRYSKGYYRRGAAYLAMGKFKEALKDFQQVKKLRPNDPDASKKLKECEKAVMKLKFEEAIAVPQSERRSVADSIDYHSIDVEPQYSGARIEGDVITVGFVKKMIEDFKNQKCLHKRYAFQIVLQTREMLRALPSLVDINVPHGKHFTVCGDVHGQVIFLYIQLPKPYGSDGRKTVYKKLAYELEFISTIMNILLAGRACSGIYFGNFTPEQARERTAGVVFLIAHLPNGCSSVPANEPRHASVGMNCLVAEVFLS